MTARCPKAPMCTRVTPTHLRIELRSRCPPRSRHSRRFDCMYQSPKISTPSQRVQYVIPPTPSIPIIARQNYVNDLRALSTTTSTRKSRKSTFARSSTTITRRTLGCPRIQIDAVDEWSLARGSRQRGVDTYARVKVASCVSVKPICCCPAVIVHASAQNDETGPKAVQDYTSLYYAPCSALSSKVAWYILFLPAIITSIVRHSVLLFDNVYRLHCLINLSRPRKTSRAERAMPGVNTSAPHRAGPTTGPSWVGDLLKASYFVSCPQHAAAHKSDRNFFCADCGEDSLCQLCVKKRHAGHTIVQVRKSSHHDAVRVSEISRLLDIQHIQHYTINQSKIVFLNARPQPKPMKGAVYTCECCHRTLIDAYRFCSIECKQTAALEGDASVSLQPRVVSGATTGGCGSMDGLPEEERGTVDNEIIRTSGNWRKRVHGFPHFCDVAELPDVHVAGSYSGSEGEEAGKASIPGVNKKRCVSRIPPALIAASPSSSFADAPSTPERLFSVSSSHEQHRRKGVPHRSALW